MKILVTGGAGYIGSHVVKQLGEAGHEIIIYDNLSTGHEWAVLYGELVVGDMADSARLQALMQQHKFDAVMHFAASIVVSESVQDPLKYYANNTVNSLNLLQACERHGIDRIIFSSTAAVYGTPAGSPITEDCLPAPENPYGRSKWMIEQMLADLAAPGSLRYISLRYFNAAGADPEGRIGEAHDPETHLIPLALQVASGRRKQLTIYGTDYPTPDGTCIRDYIHIDDLAAAHLRALNYLASGGASAVLNCGYGHGYSVREVVESVRGITGHAVPVQESGRRPGDPAELVAQCSRIRELLSWQPQYDDLATIVQDAWRWERISADQDLISTI